MHLYTHSSASINYNTTGPTGPILRIQRTRARCRCSCGSSVTRTLTQATLRIQRCKAYLLRGLKYVQLCKSQGEETLEP